MAKAKIGYGKPSMFRVSERAHQLHLKRSSVSSMLHTSVMILCSLPGNLISRQILAGNGYHRRRRKTMHSCGQVSNREDSSSWQSFWTVEQAYQGFLRTSPYRFANST